MNRRLLLRVLAAVLWLYAGWGIGNLLALLFGLNGAVGPLVGIALADLFAGDPFHLIWSPRPRRSPTPALTPDADGLR